MRTTLPCLLAAGMLFNTFVLTAQVKPEKLQDFLFSQTPSEGIHLHLDKDIYLPSETVWFKAYTWIKQVSAGNSANLFLELREPGGKILQEFVAPIIDGVASGQFQLPDSVNAQTLLIRAFTRSSLATDHIYTRSIQVIGGKTAFAERIERPASLQLFPEGGTFINNVSNVVAFKATTGNGFPYEFSGIIKDAKGKSLDSIHTVHDGMGSFIFYPKTADSCFIEWKDDRGDIRTTPLPTSADIGIALQVMQQKGRMSYYIQNPYPVDLLSELFFVISSGQQVLFAASLKTDESRQSSGSIPIEQLGTGILRVTVFNKIMQPLAERIIFMNKEASYTAAAINIEQRSIEKRGKNIISISVKDTLPQNLSISVTDADLVQESGTGIFSNLLLSGELRGYVHKPEQYFKDTSAETTERLDLVMRTNGWRRYNWSAVSNASNSFEPLLPETYISYTGVVSDKNEQPVKDALISMITRTKDSSGQVSMLATDERGMFHQPGMVFWDSASLYYQVAGAERKEYNIKITPGNELLFPQRRFDSLAFYPIAVSKSPASLTRITNAFTVFQNEQFEKKAKTLQEVVVKTTVKDPLQLMDEKYSKLYQGAKGGRMFDIMNDPVATPSKKPLEYLMRWKMPARPLYPFVFIYVDEVNIPPAQMSTIRMEQIAYAKYVPEDFQRAFASALYIYLKNDDDYFNEAQKKLDQKLRRSKLAGYTPVKEFYHPDYSLQENKDNKRTDLQTTLFWQPQLIVDQSTGTIKIEFYNNDVSDKLKVVVEGMNQDGKIVRLEKLLE